MEQVIGYAIIVWTWTNEFGADLLWVDEITVEKNYRGFGLGRKFFSWLQESYSHTPAFSLLVAEHNHKAKKLYQEIGFKPIQQQMLKVNNIQETILAQDNTKVFAEAV